MHLQWLCGTSLNTDFCHLHFPSNDLQSTPNSSLGETYKTPECKQPCSLYVQQPLWSLSGYTLHRVFLQAKDLPTSFRPLIHIFVIFV